MRFLSKVIALIFLTFLSACQEDDATLDQIIIPQNLTVSTTVTTDGSGNVTFSASADNAITYKYVFQNGSSAVAPSGTYTNRFTRTGLNSYQVTVIAYGKGGVSSSKLVEVEVESDFSDFEAVQLLTGGGTKTWYWAADVPNHLGVGPNNDDETQNYFWAFFSFTEPFALADIDAASCAYDDEFIFSTTDGENMTYVYDNKGATFFNRSYASVANGTSPDDSCYEFDTSGQKQVNLAPSESVVEPQRKRGTVMNFTDKGFMGYYIGTSQYEILSLTENRMVVRAIQENDKFLAWYQIFTSEKPIRGEDNDDAEEDDFDSLVWSDEFNAPGAPNTDNWGYDLGTGNNGWGNGESQYYTDRSDNIIVEDGLLKITLKKESFEGSEFTSSRIQTKDKFEFTYGRVEARAKLPTGGGTWPAIWSLGADFETNPWPAAGEMDIMEHVGNQQNTIFSTLHFPGNSGGNGVTENTVVDGVSDDFHVYAMEWTETQIRFYVDDEEYHVFENNGDLPFNKNFFLIMNVAMGGNFGGNIDPAFTSSTMEVDYIRVYQKS
ncbi:MAG: glycoside hydrolase family 16 protein [Leeuwenhoekiella sp.]